MMFLNITYTPLKTVSYFNKPYYDLITTVKCEDNSLQDLKLTYASFAQDKQKYIKVKPSNFLNIITGAMVHLDEGIKLEYIHLVNGSNKIIKEWKSSKPKEFISSYNKEIIQEIFFNLTLRVEKLQIKIKVNEKIEEFVFREFIYHRGEYVEFTNCHFSTQKECYLNYFPKEIHSMNYQLYYKVFWGLMDASDLEQYDAKNIKKSKNLKSSTIKIEKSSSELFYNLEEFEEPSGLKFKDFNLSIQQSNEFDEAISTLETDSVIEKPLILSFETTEEIQKINFTVFVSEMNPKGKQIRIKKVFIEILPNGKVTRKIEMKSFILMEIQKEENFLKVILGRPTLDPKTPIETKDSLSIDFIDLSKANKSTKITLDAEEKIENDYTFTTFTVEKDKNEADNSNLYDAMTKLGLVSITLNGKNGIIGTYGLSATDFESYNCIYSDKLISIPFVEKQNVVQKKSKKEFFTKKIILIVVLVGILICVCFFAYFYANKKENSLDTI